ncbi:type II toxin-antitoxin system RelB/DinJ family antitoxin [bacterium]|nr:type II toxin-antitoxin system RelB/DinJ family antitoxin [bacterium]
MARDAMIRARTQISLKAEVENIFKELGLTPTEAINLFYNQVRLRRGLPFKVEIPNAKTELVLNETRQGKDLHEYDNIDELFQDLEK